MKWQPVETAPEKIWFTKVGNDILPNSQRVSPEDVEYTRTDIADTLRAENARLRAEVERIKAAADEMAIDMSISANNAQDAAKNDPRWEGVADKLRIRVANYRAALAHGEADL